MSDGAWFLLGAMGYVFVWGALFHILKHEADGPLFSMLWLPFLCLFAVLSPFFLAWKCGAWLVGLMARSK